MKHDLDPRRPKAPSYPLPATVYLLEMESTTVSKRSLHLTLAGVRKAAAEFLQVVKCHEQFSVGLASTRQGWASKSKDGRVAGRLTMMNLSP